MLCAEDRIDKGFFPYEQKPRSAMIHNDHLATPQKMTDGTQAIVWAADYKPFGEATVTISTVTNNLRFPGQYFDAETGLNYNYFRDYNPMIGRYIEADRLGIWGGSNHLFVYAKNNPVFWTDPRGLCGCEPDNLGYAGCVTDCANTKEKKLKDIDFSFDYAVRICPLLSSDSDLIGAAIGTAACIAEANDKRVEMTKEAVLVFNSCLPQCKRSYLCEP